MRVRTRQDQRYFIQPTVLRVDDPGHELMKKELFGPVLTVFVYDDNRLEEALELCDTSSPYALTGAVFARDRREIIQAMDKLCHTAGNFYINDKPTRRGWNAALRRRQKLRNQRQGGKPPEPSALDHRPDGEGELRPAAGLEVPLPELGIPERRYSS